MSDPVSEWTDALGLEEPLWKLGLGEDENENENEVYPERPHEADCIYYLRTGVCGYGSRCRYNHPRDRAVSLVGAMKGSVAEYPERIGQPECQYYMQTGLCKFGSSCKYHHPRQGTGSSSRAALNVSGYPLRPGEKECTYFVRTGQCKFGVICKFHHPQPTSMVPSPAPAVSPTRLSPMPSAIYQNVQSSVISSQPYGVLAGNWPVARPPVLPGSYLPGTYGPMLVPPGMVPFPGWNPYQVPIHPAVSPNPQLILGRGSVYAMTQLPTSVPSYSLTSSQKENVLPQRPGEPECEHYVKTGDCKFGSSCRYHHPLDLIVPNTNFRLSPMGLPLRPGSPLCIHYAQNGVCKFGPSCKFNHPMGTLRYSPSASSLSDMPVAPYPLGSYVGTLALSSSSSDLRPEHTTVGSSLSKSMQISQSAGWSN